MPMQRTIRKIGNSKGILLSVDMLAHLGVDETVEISMEPGKIVLTAPTGVTVKPGKRQSVREAIDATFAQYGDAMQELADYKEAP